MAIEQKVNGVTMHCHKCDNCETIWQHPNPTLDTTEAEYARRHSCPTCGTDQRYKYDLSHASEIDVHWTGDLPDTDEQDARDFYSFLMKIFT